MAIDFFVPSASNVLLANDTPLMSYVALAIDHWIFCAAVVPSAQTYPSSSVAVAACEPAFVSTFPARAYPTPSRTPICAAPS